jgi:hypothetical protein
VPGEAYREYGDHYEHLVIGRNASSVGLSVFSLYAFIHQSHSAKIHLTNEQQILVEDAFQKFGPIPRICIDYIQDQSKLTFMKEIVSLWLHKS